MDRTAVETVMGALVLAVAIGFAVFAFRTSNIQTDGSYPLSARFDNVDGIGIGSDVRVGGIKVGVVSDLTLDQETYEAVMSLRVREGVAIPADSTAAIVSESLLGSRYVDVTPGGDTVVLSAGDIIRFTQSAVNLESLIGRFMFSGGGVSEGSASSNAGDALDSLGLDDPESTASEW